MSSSSNAPGPSGSPVISTLSFLTPGNFLDDNPYPGLEDTLALFEFGEQLGYDGAWIRQRHLEHGVGSAAIFLAAAGQRTERIQLGTAVIPIGYESPFRLAEDLSLADVLSLGRLQAGFSAGTPPHADLIGHLVFDGDWRTHDLSHERISRLMDNLRGDFLGDPDTVIRTSAPSRRRDRGGFSSRRIWSGPPRRSSSGCTRTPRRRRSRSCGWNCRTSSTAATTSRSCTTRRS
jgi:alkanesulfonate monooxygenase SsuD/methylene tetrahydromethanopterin reductase-like flavin-dependent oxidoreductase (luciferase family)